MPTTVGVLSAALVVVALPAAPVVGANPMPSHAPLAGTTVVGPAIGALATDGRSVWAAYADGVARIDAVTGDVVLRTTTGVNGSFAAPAQVAAGDGEVWLAGYTHGVVAPVDPTSGAIDDARRVPVAETSGMALGSGSLWITSAAHGTVTRVDTTSGSVSATIDVPVDGPVTAGLGAVWVASTHSGGLVRIDPATNATTAVHLGLAAGDVVTAVGVGGGAAWVGTLGGTLYRVDPASGEVTAIDAATVPVPQFAPVGGIAVADDDIWVTGTAYTGRSEDWVNAPGFVVRIDPTRLAVADAWMLDPPGANASVLAAGSLWVAEGFTDVQRIPTGDAPPDLPPLPVGSIDEPIAFERSLTYASDPDGTAVPLDVYRPADAAGAPIVILLPGGPGAFGQRDYLAGFAAALAERDLIVLNADYRSPATGGSLDDARRDVACAVAWARDHASEHGGDASRVVAAGHSYGGELLLDQLLAGPEAATCDGQEAVPDAYVPIGKIRADLPVPASAGTDVPVSLAIGVLDDEHYLARSFRDQLASAGYRVDLVEVAGVDHLGIIDTRPDVPTVDAIARLAEATGG